VANSIVSPAAGRLVTEPLAARENREVSKTRQVIQQLRNWLFDALRPAPFGIDVFEGRWKVHCWLKEFDSAADADALTLPSFFGRKCLPTIDSPGEQLVPESREHIRAWLREYGIWQRRSDWPAGNRGECFSRRCKLSI